MRHFDAHFGVARGVNALRQRSSDRHVHTFRKGRERRTVFRKVCDVVITVIGQRHDIRGLDRRRALTRKRVGVEVGSEDGGAVNRTVSGRREVIRGFEAEVSEDGGDAAVSDEVGDIAVITRRTFR